MHELSHISGELPQKSSDRLPTSDIHATKEFERCTAFNENVEMVLSVELIVHAVMFATNATANVS